VAVLEPEELRLASSHTHVGHATRLPARGAAISASLGPR
jgi:hypothetical protein